MVELLIPNQRVAGSIPVRVNIFCKFSNLIFCLQSLIDEVDDREQSLNLASNGQENKERSTSGPQGD